MSEFLRDFLSGYREAAEQHKGTADKVIPCVFLLPSETKIDERMGELMKTEANGETLAEAEAYPVFLMPDIPGKNFSANILFPMDDRGRKLFKRVVDKIKSQDSKYRKDAKKFEDELAKDSNRAIITKTNLAQMFAAVKRDRENNPYNGAFGYVDPPLILLDDEYDPIKNEQGEFRMIPDLRNDLKRTKSSDGAESPTKDSGQDKEQPPLVEEIAELLESNFQVILTGPPGTGKTYLARQVAARMIFGKDWDGYEKDAARKRQFDEQYAFVQFHPSYDYTDFVEGLRPCKEPGKVEIGFELVDGTFKSFCRKAQQNLLDSNKTEQDIISKQSAEAKINDFLNGAIEKEKVLKTVNGNEFRIMEIDGRHIKINIPGNGICKDVVLPYSKIFRIVSEGELPPTVSKLKDIFDSKVQTQMDSYIFAICRDILKRKDAADASYADAPEKVERKNFVFVIDEINRGDISKIFGELFYAIDPGYRGESGKVKTQYANLADEEDEEDSFRKGFFVPENVYIIGTMNDIDRSVESMDFAIRRRFTWKEITADATCEAMWATMPEKYRDEARKRMKQLNQKIENTEPLNSAFHVGPAYFLKLKEYDGDFEKLWKLHIGPLLKEYLRGSRDEIASLDKLKKAYAPETAPSKDKNGDDGDGDGQPPVAPAQNG